MSEASFEDYKPLKVTADSIYGDEVVAMVIPNGEDAEFKITSDVSQFSDRALRHAITELASTIRAKNIKHELYYEVPRSDKELSHALTGSGFEKTTTNDDYDYYSPLRHMDSEDIAVLDTVQFSPELAEAIERILEDNNIREMYYEDEFMLHYGEFNSFIIQAGTYFEDGWPIYWLKLKLKGRSESVYKTRYPTEAVELHIAPNTGKIISYTKEMQELDENNREVPLPNVGNAPFLLEINDQIRIMNEEEAHDLSKEVFTGIDQCQYEEIIEYVDKVLAEYKLD